MENIQKEYKQTINTMPESLQDYSLRKKIKKDRNGTIQKVGLVGCGTTGQEIVRLISEHGIEVTFIDISKEMVESIMKSITLFVF